MSYSLHALYRAVGISKQAVHQYEQRQQVFDRNVQALIVEVDDLRRDHPGCGVEKMYYTLRPDFIGRDRFVELMMQLGYRIKRKKNYRRTTFSASVYYPNFIQGMELDAPSMVWQSDITYFAVGECFFYGVFITDVYNRRIVGHQVSDHMRATANIKALQMALNVQPAPAIHHSDRGSQYIYRHYVDLLQKLGVRISMGQTAQDNAYAERVHRTIKEEYIDHWKPKNLPELRQMVTKAVDHYNHTRPHNSLGKVSPEAFTEQWKELPPEQRRKLIIFDNLFS